MHQVIRSSTCLARLQHLPLISLNRQAAPRQGCRGVMRTGTASQQPCRDLRWGCRGVKQASRGLKQNLGGAQAVVSLNSVMLLLRHTHSCDSISCRLPTSKLSVVLRALAGNASRLCNEWMAVFAPSLANTASAAFKLVVRQQAWRCKLLLGCCRRVMCFSVMAAVCWPAWLGHAGHAGRESQCRHAGHAGSGLGGFSASPHATGTASCLLLDFVHQCLMGLQRDQWR